jgi:hypothetical protein
MVTEFHSKSSSSKIFTNFPANIALYSMMVSAFHSKKIPLCS